MLVVSVSVSLLDKYNPHLVFNSNVNKQWTTQITKVVIVLHNLPFF